ncbi:MAG: radical SAM protein [Candidatus Omnitrophota bacterium]
MVSNLTNLTFIVTDDCNFNCSYCPQKKEKKTMNHQMIETAVDVFYPLLKEHDSVLINFYGGEPTLAFEQIRHAVRLIEEKNKTGHKKIVFAMTTNGSLLNHEMLNFFNRHRFRMLLSFDGLAQDEGRKKGSFEKMLGIINGIRDYPDISFEINSVFSPRTIGTFTESMRFLIDLEGPEVTFNIDALDEWGSEALDVLEKEMARFTDFMITYYNEKGKMPVKNFRGDQKQKKVSEGIFHCNAGNDHMALTPEGDVWGCFHFHDYFKTRTDDPQYQDYHLGTLTDVTNFITNYDTHYSEIKNNYLDLRQDFFQVDEGEGRFCFLCEEMAECSVCPVVAAYRTGTVGKISCQMCRLVKIQRNARKKFIHARA